MELLATCELTEQQGLFVCYFIETGSLYSPGSHGTCSVLQDDLKLKDPPASASQVLKLKVCGMLSFGKTPTHIQQKIRVSSTYPLQCSSVSMVTTLQHMGPLTETEKDIEKIPLCEMRLLCL